MPHHIVCHDCEAEGVEDDETTANFLRDAHREMYRHDVEVEEVEAA